MVSATMRVADTYVLNAVADSSHANLIIFTLVIGGTVGVVARAGGLQGIVDKLSRYAKGPISTQLLATFVGLVMFVDDYANTLIVGNSMRPLTDSKKVSREKLSFIVDATAAPIASLAVISTWIGYEIGLIGEALTSIESSANAYLVFIGSLPFRFYAILLLVFIVMGCVMRREFGPMLAAERRASKTGKTLRPGSQPLMNDEVLEPKLSLNVPSRWYNGVFPIFALVITVFIVLYQTGVAALDSAIASPGFKDIIGGADPFKALMQAALVSSLVAIVMTIWQRICTLQEALDAWVNGTKAMMLAMIILSLAWALAGVIKDVGTATALTEMTRGILTPQLLPALVFLISSVIAFASGTSWGTMALLFPTAIPLLHELSGINSIAVSDYTMLMHATVGAILTGAILGDHVSPISDTTVMSSMASAVDHLDHVNTQLPYALVVGGIALLLGYLPAGYGVNPYLLTLIGTVSLYGVFKFFGKNPDVD